jgi:hypothetical protein
MQEVRVIRATVRLAGAAVFMLTCGDVARAQQPIDRELARQYFVEARELGERGAYLWRQSLHGPIVMVDRASRTAVANQPDPAGAFRLEDGVWVGPLPEELGIANTGFGWQGQNWTMLVWPLPYGRLERQRLVAHELFHRLQRDLAMPGGSPPNMHLGEETARYWLRLELRALRDAVAASDDARPIHIEDAVVFRARRHELYPAGVSEEIELELNEGLAEYTGVMAGLPANARAGWVARELEGYDARAASASVVRNFAYQTGPAWGLLLDAVGAQWRTRDLTGIDLAALVAEALDVSLPQPLQRHAEERALRYDAGQIAAEESTRNARLAEVLARFQYMIDGPRLVLPAAEPFRYEFNPNRTEVLGEHGVVYGVTRVRAAWGVLEGPDGGAIDVLLVRDGDGRLTHAVVSAPADADAPLRGSGWSLQLVEGWEIARAAAPGEWLVRPISR